MLSLERDRYNQIIAEKDAKIKALYDIIETKDVMLKMALKEAFKK